MRTFRLILCHPFYQKDDKALGSASKGRTSSPGATLALQVPGSLWWSCRLDQGWSEPRRSPAGWSLSPLYREPAPTPPPWNTHMITVCHLLLYVSDSLVSTVIFSFMKVLLSFFIFNRQTLFPDLSIHWAARQAVVRISLTWVCQLEASSLLNQRSILCDWSLHASTSFIRLSWSTLDLETTDLLQHWRECLNSSYILNHIASKES